MSPLRGEEFTGRTVEEAIERGLRALGRKRTEVDIEVLEKGKPANVLGMGGEDARVMLSFQEDERAAEPANGSADGEGARRRRWRTAVHRHVRHVRRADGAGGACDHTDLGRVLRLRLDGHVVSGARGEATGERESAVGGDRQVIARVVLQHEAAARERVRRAADGKRRRWWRRRGRRCRGRRLTAIAPAQATRERKQHGGHTGAARELRLYFVHDYHRSM